MEEILNNLPVFIPLAIIIAVRIWQSRAKNSGSRREARGKTFFQGSPFMASPAAEADNEEEHIDDYAEMEEKKILTTEGTEEEKREEEKIFFPLADKQVHYPPAEAQEDPPLPPKNRGGFPGISEKLSPLQRAVVWAEILGKPKGA
jgi:hypothetical protein